MSEKKQDRDYNKEYERDKKLNKIYRVRVPKDIAEKLDKKLAERHEKYSSIAMDAIIKYLRNK